MSTAVIFMVSSGLACAIACAIASVIRVNKLFTEMEEERECGREWLRQRQEQLNEINQRLDTLGAKVIDLMPKEKVADNVESKAIGI